MPSAATSLNDRIAYDIPAAVASTGISRTRLYKAIQEGTLTVRKSGRRTLVEAAELRRFIANLPSVTGPASARRSP